MRTDRRRSVREDTSHSKGEDGGAELVRVSEAGVRRTQVERAGDTESGAV